MNKAPNILFFFPDQWRFDWLGTNRDLPLRTPNINKLKSRGISFTNAYCNSPICAPSRAALASGKSYEKCGVASNQEDFPLETPTFYQILRDAGYRTASFGKLDLHKNILDWGIDGRKDMKTWGFTDGFDNEGKLDATSSLKTYGMATGPYMNLLQEHNLTEIYKEEHATRNKNKDAYTSALNNELYCDNWISQNALNSLENFSTDSPWFMQINFTGPHNPMDVTKEMRERWQDITFPLPINNNDPEYSEEDHQRNRQNYAAMIENIDYQIGRFIKTLEERGELDNTLIVFSSDHGELLGDFNLWGKCSWREASTRVPLIVAGPEIRMSSRTNALVNIHDYAATFIDYAGAYKKDGMDSESIRPILNGEKEEHRKFIRSGLTDWDRDWKMVFDGRYKLVKDKDTTLLFDLKYDPLEETDISEENKAIVKSLKPYL